jgi:KaiC/GvpD/RAD55 family RecA-like ATPase
MATAYKKRIPNENELAFLTIASKIKDGHTVSQDEIACITGYWHNIATCLSEAYTRDGAQGFWKVYEAYYKDYPQLKEWRDLVEMPTAPDDEEKAGEEPDKRFISSESGKRLLKLESIEDIYETPDAEYLIAKILETATVSMLYGTTGTGKTFTSVHTALSVAHGLLWNGRKTKAGPVWFINTEGRRGLKKRIRAWYAEHPELELSANFKIIPWSLDLREYLQELQNTLDEAKEKPVLIVIDNFSMCTNGIEQNKQEQVAPVLRDLHELAETYACHIMIVHHTNKDDDFNGTMAFKNHVDAMIKLRKEDKADKDSPIIISSEKARDDEPFKDIRMELKSVNLYYDEENQDFITSCVTVPYADTPVKANDLKDGPRNALDILGDRHLSHSEWQKECIKELGISTSTFDRYIKELLKKGYIRKGKTNGKVYEVYHAVVREGEARGE